MKEVESEKQGTSQKDSPPGADGDSSRNVAKADEHPGSAGGSMSGGGTWRADPDKDGARSRNDDGYNYQYNFPPDKITGSPHGPHHKHDQKPPGSDSKTATKPEKSDQKPPGSDSKTATKPEKSDQKPPGSDSKTATKPEKSDQKPPGSDSKTATKPEKSDQKPSGSDSKTATKPEKSDQKPSGSDSKTAARPVKSDQKPPLLEHSNTMDGDKIVRRKFEEGAGPWRSPKESKTKANELAKKTGHRPEDRHLSHEISRWKTKAGERVYVRNESKIDNLKRSAAERKACGQARARGEYTREGGRDLTAPADARQTPKEIKPPTAKPSAPPTPADVPHGAKPSTPADLPSGAKPSTPADLPPGAKPSTPADLPPGAKPSTPADLPPGAKPSTPVEPPAVGSSAGPSAVEGLAGKLGGIAGVIGGILAVRTLADDFKMHTNPSDPTLGPVGTIRTDSLGNQWIKTDEKTWVSKAYHDKMA